MAFETASFHDINQLSKSGIRETKMKTSAEAYQKVTAVPPNHKRAYINMKMGGLLPLWKWLFPWEPSVCTDGICGWGVSGHTKQTNPSKANKTGGPLCHGDIFHNLTAISHLSLQSGNTFVVISVKKEKRKKIQVNTGRKKVGFLF